MKILAALFAVLLAGPAFGDGLPMIIDYQARSFRRHQKASNGFSIHQQIVTAYRCLCRRSISR